MTAIQVFSADRMDVARGYFGMINVPKEITDLQAKQRAANPKPTDEKKRDYGWTGVNYVPRGQTNHVLQWHATNVRDASRSMIAAENADLFVMRYAYGTGKGMEAWIKTPPKDGKLKLNVVTTPSWHAGSTPEQKKKMGEKFARENTYIVEVKAPGQKAQRQQFKIKNAPEYASVTPNAFEIDLSQKGDIIVTAWPVGSAGVGGYSEARKFTIHNP